MTVWRIIRSPEFPGQANMDHDLKLFQDFEEGLVPSTLRIYSWKPNCISLGYAQKVEKEINIVRATAMGWDVVKRPTGGGIVFHNEGEVTYSLVVAIDDPLLPKGLVPSYKKISEAVVIALNNCGVHAEINNSSFGIRNSSLCFSYPAEYEIVVEGKKIVGSAQKRGRKALLQQGSIFVSRTPEEAFSVLKRRHGDVDAVSVEEILGRIPSFAELSQALIDGFREGLGFEI